jgi:adenine-specific DNA-methyltransferase
MAGKQKLELTWIGKENRPRLEPRILLEDPAKSYHAPHRVSENDIFDNRLIFGDNLLALKALEQEFTGKIKCIYIDPPFNTGAAFAHYDDGVEHSLWLSLMRERLEVLWRLLASDGAIWINIDDHEGHYLKVLCDEVFGRSTFVSTVIWENFYGRSNAAAISPCHNYIHVYAPLGLDWKKVRRLLPRDAKSASKYKNPDNDPRGPWRLGPIFASEERHEGLMYTVRTPAGRAVSPPKGSHWRMVEADFWNMVRDGRITFGNSGDNNPAVKLFLNEVQDGLVPRSIWPHTEAGHSQEAKREIQTLFPDEVPFGTPKPERLLQRVIEISSNPGDWVLDSFAGSGTTGAVAHKMNRRWIMVELGNHCDTHIAVRLKKIIDGEDNGGISAAKEVLFEEKLSFSKINKGAEIVSEIASVEAKYKDQFDSFEKSVEDGHLRLYGIAKALKNPIGGGFRYYKVAPSLLEQDEYRNWVISKEYNPAMLAEAVCKLEGFHYAPSDEYYWQHGHSTESDYIFVTTQTLSREQLQKLNDEVGPNRSLLVCCGAYRTKKLDEFPQLTVKKIPKAVMQKCEWGKDDYSLEIKALPDPRPAESTPVDPVLADLPKNKRKARKLVESTPSLFSKEELE